MNLHKVEKVHINHPSGSIQYSGKRLNVMQYPQIYDAEDTMQEVIWNTEYWCDNCAIIPFLKLYSNRNKRK